MKKVLIILSVLIILFFVFRNINFESDTPDTGAQDIGVQVSSSDSLSLLDFEFPEYSNEQKSFIDTSNSFIEWVGENKLRNIQHKGNLDITENSYLVLDESASLTSGFVEIDMTTLRGDNEPQGLINHLRSSDFFDVDTYKTARFDILSIEKSQARGLLTIKDITREIDFSFTEDREAGRFAGQFSFDRSLWNITTLSRSFFANLGDSVVEDVITINFDVSASF